MKKKEKKIPLEVYFSEMIIKIYIDLQVKHKADTTAWNTSGVNGCSWTLLHRAIFESDEDTACFLIRNACDVNR